jgi:putative transposase
VLSNSEGSKRRAVRAGENGNPAQNVLCLSCDRLAVSEIRLRRCNKNRHPICSLLNMSIKTDTLRKAGAILYAYNWGVDKGKISFSESDYGCFVTRMADYLEPSKISLLAYTILPDMFHLIVRQLVPYGLSHYLKNVCDGYARAVNRSRRRSGHLFQGRYRLRELREEREILCLSYSIHMGAVLSGLTQDPLLWRHSSLKHYADVTTPELVDTGLIYGLAGGRERYLEFLRDFDHSDPLSSIRYMAKGNPR